MGRDGHTGILTVEDRDGKRYSVFLLFLTLLIVCTPIHEGGSDLESLLTSWTGSLRRASGASGEPTRQAKCSYLFF